MDISRQDPEQLLTLQKAAGYLNLSVDELLQLGRGPSSSTLTLGAGASQPHYARQDSYGDRQLFSLPADGSDDLFWDHSQGLGADAQQQDGNLFAPADFQRFATAGPSFERHSPSQSGPFASGSGSQERVILLNPEIENAWYACNMDYHMVDFGEISDSDPNVSSGTDGFIPVAPHSHDSDAESESTARDEDVDMLSADDEEERTLVPTPADRRSSSSLGSRQYKLIAPRPGAVKTPSDGSSPGVLGHRIRKKRAPYTATRRHDTNLTRSVNACVRCRIQRNRCIPDPNNPRGPCQSCQNKKARLSRLPCLRYKLSDSILFRTGLDYMPFYKSHPMTGPRYGDFHIEKTWIDGAGRYLCLSQDRGSFLRIELRQFVPPNDPTALDLKGRSMYATNWAIADPDAVTEALNEFIDNSLGYYLESILDGTDGLVWDVFHAAIRSSVFPQPNLLLRQSLRLWVVCRFIESRWRCWTDLEEEEDITQQFPDDPFYDWKSPPPYVDYQFASIIIHRVLNPLREEILRELERMVEKHKAEDWYVTFLTAFILLHNYELQIQFQRDFARRRGAPVRYLDMPLVRATNSGSATILAHFHYCSKGNQPFGEKFDWNSARNRKMARLDAEQSRFMAGYRDRVIAKAEAFSQINHSNQYDDPYWYTSQLFDPDWKPRDTLEHAPPAEWAH